MKVPANFQIQIAVPRGLRSENAIGRIARSGEIFPKENSNCTTAQQESEQSLMFSSAIPIGSPSTVTVAQGVAALITADTNLQNVGIYATASGSVIYLKSKS